MDGWMDGGKTRQTKGIMMDGWIDELDTMGSVRWLVGRKGS